MLNAHSFLAKKSYINSLFIVSVAILTACQSKLDVKPDGQGDYIDTDQTPRVGVDYDLPMLQFNISITRTLVQCESEGPAGGKPDIRFLAKVVAKPFYTAGERYVIDYQALSSWSKISGFELEKYDNGIIKSVNANSEDKTAAIVGNVIKTGIGLASLSSGVPAAALDFSDAPPGAKTETAGCTIKTKTLLNDVKQAELDLKNKTEALIDLTDEIGRLERAAGINAISEATKGNLEKLKKAMKEAAQKVKHADTSLSSLIGRISVSDELIWPTSISESTLNAMPGPKNEKKLLALFNYGQHYDLSEANLKQSFAVNGRLAAVISEANQNSEDTTLKIEKEKLSGLFYRSPIPAQLLICQMPFDEIESCNTKSASAVIINDNVMAPQLGTLRTLPFTNGIFQNNVLIATFRESGGISKLTYDNKAARGEALSETAAEGLGSVLAYRDAKKALAEEQATKLETAAAASDKAEMDALDNEIAKLEKQKTINSLKSTAELDKHLTETSAETTHLNAQIALLEAKRKSREAQKALDELDEEQENEQ